MVDFFERAGRAYSQSYRCDKFVLHILRMKVPRLFAIEHKGEQPSKDDEEVVNKFCIILKKHGVMEAKHLMGQLDKIMVRSTLVSLNSPDSRPFPSL